MDPKPAPISVSAPLALAGVLLAVVLGVAVAVILLHGVPGLPSLPHVPAVPGVDKPLPTPETRQPVILDWVATSDQRTYLGLRDDGSVIWRRTKRIGDIGDLPPTGKPIGDKPPTGTAR